jgi:integrase
MIAQGSAFTIELWLKSLDLAPKTKGNIRNVMAVVFECGMRWGLIDLQNNPMSLVRIKNVSHRQVEPRVLTLKEIQALMAELGEEPLRTAIILAMGTGLRCSELFALKWMDFNWEDLTLLVRRAIVDSVVGDVKTKYSRSGLPIDASLAEILSGWRQQARFSQESDWVFASPHKAGELPYRPTAFL